jgi:hypothetical protein
MMDAKKTLKEHMAKGMKTAHPDAAVKCVLAARPTATCSSMVATWRR